MLGKKVSQVKTIYSLQVVNIVNVVQPQFKSDQRCFKESEYNTCLLKTPQ